MLRTIPGINLCMALYGLSVFLETSGAQRKGRKRYIASSFAITVLSALVASSDMALYFQVLFKSTSPTDWSKLFRVYYKGGWMYFFSYTGLGLVITIGDALLVRPVISHFQPFGNAHGLFYRRCIAAIVCTEYWWVTILPTITSLIALGLFRVHFKV